MADKHSKADKADKPNKPDKPAYAIPEWCVDLGVSQSFYYKEHRNGRGPRIARMGRRTIILESPAAFLKRIARSQARKPPGGSTKPGELAAAE